MWCMLDRLIVLNAYHQSGTNMNVMMVMMMIMMVVTEMRVCGI